MKTIGLVLVTLGILVLVYGGFSYNRERTVLDVGPIKATTTEHHHVPLSPIVGGVAIIGGLILLTVRRGQTA